MATDQIFKTKKMEKPVAALYGRPYDHGHWEDMERGYTAEKKKRERYWIHQLRSMAPEGMNLEDLPANTATDAWGTPPVYTLV